jgi:hypothetical protein
MWTQDASEETDLEDLNINALLQMEQASRAEAELQLAAQLENLKRRQLANDQLKAQTASSSSSNGSNDDGKSQSAIKSASVPETPAVVLETKTETDAPSSPTTAEIDDGKRVQSDSPGTHSSASQSPTEGTSADPASMTTDDDSSEILKAPDFEMKYVKFWHEDATYDGWKTFRLAQIDTFNLTLSMPNRIQFTAKGGAKQSGRIAWLGVRGLPALSPMEC